MADRPRRGGLLAVAAAVAVAWIAVMGAIAVGLSIAPPLQVSIATQSTPGGNVYANYTSTTHGVAAQLHLAVVPGSERNNSDPTILFFVDPSFSPLYASFDTIYGAAARLGTYLKLIGSRDQVTLVNASNIEPALGAHPDARLLVIGTGTIPSNILSSNSSILPNWVRAGGTLIWAGGPLGYTSGYSTPAGFVYTSLGWAGQERFLPYPLTDPHTVALPPAPPLPGTSTVNPTPLQQALGIQYDSPAVAANLTEVVANGGVPLGYIAGPVNGSSLRTTLAWVPDGAGSIFFFGGAEFFPGLGTVPDASTLLANDLFLIVALSYHPALGPSDYADVSLGAFQSTRTQLVAGPSTYASIAFAESETVAALLFFHAQPARPATPIP